MVKTEWICDDCGAKFNSRSARLYHRNHTCKAEGKVVTEDEKPEEKTEIDLDVPESPKESTIEENKKKYKAATGIDVSGSEGGIAEQEPLADPAIPAIVMIPIIIVVLLMAGILIFRDRIMEIFGFKKQPPQAVIV
jgi:hypothetical protein